MITGIPGTGSRRAMDSNGRIIAVGIKARKAEVGKTNPTLTIRLIID